MAPSVGLGKPWRFALVEDVQRRHAVKSSFPEANAEALAGYCGDRARLYAALKLEGLAEAPVHLAVFCDEQTDQGHGLGRHTMPERLTYSVVAAIQLLWLSAQSQGVGVGWASILKPQQIKEALEIPDPWRSVASLWLGYPQEEQCEPDLATAGWEQRREIDHIMIRR